MADLSVLTPVMIGLVVVVGLVVGVAAIVKAFYFKVEQGTALIVNDT